MTASIVFTDLDGTFIDFDTYSPEIAAPAARDIVAGGAHLVFCSSKTWAEQKALMDATGLDIPCIVENGAGIYLPESLDILRDLPSRSINRRGRLVSLGDSADYIRRQLSSVSRALDIDLRPYSGMSVSELASITGLDEDGVGRARDRDFSETLTASLDPDSWLEINAVLEPEGLHCVSGGRFHTVTSIDCDKGRAIELLVSDLERLWGHTPRSIGIGDSANDADMLRAVDEAYLVQTPRGTWNEMDVEGLSRVPAIGPQGWILAVQNALGNVRS